MNSHDIGTKFYLLLNNTNRTNMLFNIYIFFNFTEEKETEVKL